MIDVKISVSDFSRRKIVLIICREDKEIIKTNIDLGRMNLDRWLRD